MRGRGWPREQPPRQRSAVWQGLRFAPRRVNSWKRPGASWISFANKYIWLMECHECTYLYEEDFMNKQARMLVTGSAVLSLAIGFLATGSGGAADDKADLRATIQKIADA